jgi:SAM-dependent methyltransferase
MAKPWNVNIHYDGKPDACVPARAASVLEVGCGDGFLAARLSQRVPRVVAVDIDQPVPERAKQCFPGAQVAWTHGDFLAASERLGSFMARSNRCDGGGYTSGRPVRIRQSRSFSSTLNGN